MFVFVLSESFASLIEPMALSLRRGHFCLIVHCPKTHFGMTLKNNSRIASRDCVELANFTQEIKYLLGQLFRGLGILLFNLFASSNELALSTGLLGAGNTLDFRNLSTFRASMSADLPPLREVFTSPMGISTAIIFGCSG